MTDPERDEATIDAIVEAHGKGQEEGLKDGADRELGLVVALLHRMEGALEAAATRFTVSDLGYRLRGDQLRQIVVALERHEHRPGRRPCACPEPTGLRCLAVGCDHLKPPGQELCVCCTEAR